MDKERIKRGNYVIEELLSIPTFFYSKLNHKKDQLAFYWNKTGRFELFIMDLKTNDIEQITDGQLPKGLRAGYLWGRDDRTIYFTKDKDGDEQHNIYSLDIITKTVTQLTDTPDAQDIPLDTSVDGQWLLFNANRNHGQMNLYRLNLKTGNVEQITDHSNPAVNGKYSKDGSMIAYISNEEVNLVNHDIYIINADGSDRKRVVQTTVGSQDLFTDWSSDGSFFVFTTDVHGLNQVATYTFITEEITFFGDASVPESAAKVIGNDTILAYSTADASIKPILYDVKTKQKTVLEFPPGLAVGSELINDDEIVMMLNNPVSPSTLIRYNHKTETSTILLKTDMGTIDDSLFVDAKYIHYPSTDNMEIPAIVYQPRDFDPTKKYPAIIIPHGGPTAHYRLSFYPQAQYFVDLGYVVMLPNVRGSSGYGTAFRDACIKDWGGKDHDDWIAGRQWLIDHASVDPKKVIMYGVSYGGYATMWSLGKSPDLWAAGVSWAPVTDLLSLYDQSMEHFKFVLRQQMGDPVKDKDLWIDRSPLTHIHKMKAPMLLVAGVNDPRCPISQARDVVKKLKDHGFKEGQDFEYMEYDEGHGSSGDMTGNIRSLKLLDDFLYRKVESVK